MSYLVEFSLGQGHYVMREYLSTSFLEVCWLTCFAFKYVYSFTYLIRSVGHENCCLCTS